MIFKWGKRIVFTTFVIAIGYSADQYFSDQWEMEQILEFLRNITIRLVIPGIILFYILYKMVLEKLFLWFNRRKSAEVLANRLPQIIQKSGRVRAGKDASTVGAAMITKDYILKQEIKEMKAIREKLYIYDFKKLSRWLDNNGKRFLVSGKKIIEKQFSMMMRYNNCFIKSHLQKRINPKKHFYAWKYKRDKEVQRYSYKDGITPGGIPFLDLLLSYTVLYVQHFFVPNFVMSNQGIMESFKIDKKKIEKKYSKKFSQDYIKLKENTPIPLPLRGFIIETETAIFYSNTDKKAENEMKVANGIREFFTTAGHILQERVFFYGITQSSTRESKARRELYPGYQHVFKYKLKATSNHIRRFLGVIIFLLKVIRTLIGFINFILGPIRKLLSFIITIDEHSLTNGRFTT